MPAPPTEKLTRREREIMNVLFALGNRASAEETGIRLTDPPSSSAVRAMLARLEGKGHLRIVAGLRYVYSPTTPPAAARRGAAATSAYLSLVPLGRWPPAQVWHGPTTNSTPFKEIEQVRRERKQS